MFTKLLHLQFIENTYLLINDKNKPELHTRVDHDFHSHSIIEYTNN